MDTPAQTIHIPAAATLEGDLHFPGEASGLVIFPHGSGSSRFSSRNRAVAGMLQEAGLATLLLDLLTRDEEAVDDLTREFRFDIDLLARRVIIAIDWAAAQSRLKTLPVGLFGASTGAAAALIAAAERRQAVRAVVSRGGRPDLADEALPRVAAPTLLIVGGNDDEVIELNRSAMRRMRCETRLEIVPGATHLFEEPGALDAVGKLARDWCAFHLAQIRAPA
jgi:dienelactone hydrolase